MLFPWYPKKRQSSFSKTDISTFYNYNKCNNYEKYENYFARYNSSSNDNIDIILDKNAIELKELRSCTPEKYQEENEYSNTKDESEISENSNDILEKEIAYRMKSIVLKEIPMNDTNVFSNSIDITDTIMDNDDCIESNVSFKFQQPGSTLSVKLYPQN